MWTIKYYHTGTCTFAGYYLLGPCPLGCPRLQFNDNAAHLPNNVYSLSVYKISWRSDKKLNEKQCSQHPSFIKLTWQLNPGQTEVCIPIDIRLNQRAQKFISIDHLSFVLNVRGMARSANSISIRSSFIKDIPSKKKKLSKKEENFPS